MKLWSITKTSRGYIARCYTTNETNAFMGVDVHEQARFDTMKEAKAYVERHGGKVTW